MWAPEPVWTVWKRENSCTYYDSNSDPSVVQPVASRYPRSILHSVLLENFACPASAMLQKNLYIVSYKGLRD
jgi:hypothetical protein